MRTKTRKLLTLLNKPSNAALKLDILTYTAYIKRIRQPNQALANRMIENFVQLFATHKIAVTGPDEINGLLNDVQEQLWRQEDEQTRDKLLRTLQ